ncbi:MAG: 5-formyltetrahydrofolate cyclo-ligase [Clostridia bacterium]
MKKEEARAQASLNCKLLTAQQRQIKSEIICQKVANCEEFKNAQSVFLYNSFANEVQTKMLYELCLQQNKILYLPRVFGDNMQAVRILKQTIFTKNAWGIEEPICVSREIFCDCDLAIIPMVACDKNKNRVGRGKGYYDKFLANKTCFKLGIAFAEQVFDEIETSQHDIKMDKIITDKQ